jgi:hypothetical protein
VNHHLIEVRHTCLADPEHHYTTLVATPADRPVRDVLTQAAAQFRPWAERSPSWTVQVIYRAHLGNDAPTPTRRGNA